MSSSPGYRRNRFLLRPYLVGDRNPFEAFLLTGALLQGAAVLVGAASPTSIDQALPPTMQIIWAILLLGGGGLALIGLGWLGDPFSAIEIKRVGLVCAGFGGLVYGMAAAAFGAPGLAVGIYNICFAAACFWRLIQITIRLRGIRANLAAVRDLRGGGPDVR